MARGQSAPGTALAGGFDFTASIRRLCGDVSRRHPQLRHVEMSRVAVRFCQTRRHGSFGMHASLTPLRFEGGARTEIRGHRLWRIEPLYDSFGHEMLYLLSFYLPRFLDLGPVEKLATILHELWHISPRFDGDLRRVPGRYYAHGKSEEDFHAQMRQMARTWLRSEPPVAIYGFLELDFAALEHRFGVVRGLSLPAPRLTSRPARERACS
jgi:predicted metallopeptidase